MKKNVVLMGMGIVLALSGVNMALAADAKDAAGKKASPVVAAQVALAKKLITLGDARQDPLLLIAAAKIQKSIKDEPIATTKESLKPKDVLERAKKLANGRKDLIGLADDVATMKTKDIYESSDGSQWSSYEAAQMQNDFSAY